MFSHERSFVKVRYFSLFSISERESVVGNAVISQQKQTNVKDDVARAKAFHIISNDENGETAKSYVEALRTRPEE